MFLGEGDRDVGRYGGKRFEGCVCIRGGWGRLVLEGVGRIFLRGFEGVRFGYRDLDCERIDVCCLKFFNLWYCVIVVLGSKCKELGWRVRIGYGMWFRGYCYFF